MYILFVGFRKLGEFESILMAKQFAQESGIAGVFNVIKGQFCSSWYADYSKKQDDEIIT